ncbi:MAG: ribosome silencing factor [Dinghuibacter sp.]|nr:ribosome silencing factor [Dinghuibacter sp.]
MATVKALPAAKKKTAARLAKNSKIYKTIIKAIQDKKGEGIVTLDLRKIPEAVADFFVVCEAGNSTQLKAIADNIEMAVKKDCGEIPYRREGQQGMQWLLIDYVNIVAHVFMSGTRKFYRLEEMWSDAPLTEYS